MGRGQEAEAFGEIGRHGTYGFAIETGVDCAGLVSP